jgi:hypothetical protein
MLREEEQAISAATHKDLVLLIKEYARQGYKQTRGSTNEEFEKLWREAFRITEKESVFPAAH